MIRIRCRHCDVPEELRPRLCEDCRAYPPALTSRRWLQRVRALQRGDPQMTFCYRCEIKTPVDPRWGSLFTLCPQCLVDRMTILALHLRDAQHVVADRDECLL